MKRTEQHKQKLDELIGSIQALDIDSKISALNEIKKALHEVSPFKSEPVDCVLWIKQDKVHANDYNPNSVAPPEMELLRVSIMEDGYTQVFFALPRPHPSAHPLPFLRIPSFNSAMLFSAIFAIS